MTLLPKAIQDTINYARFFDFDLTPKELHHWLISNRTYSLSSVTKNTTLPTSLTPTRQERALLTQKKLKILHKILPLLRFLPHIRLIAVTGSLAMNNARKNDDVDIMIVTSKDTLWITRPIVILLLSLFSSRRQPHTRNSHARNTICPNLWLDLAALEIPKSKQNLYTAHEVLQIKPVLNREGTHQRFLKQNAWTKKYLANAYKEQLSKIKSSKPSSSLLYSWLNRLLFAVQYLYMRNKITNEYITLHSAYFHPRTIKPKI